ncbi:MAG: DUF4145 domain-containing protein [Anaerolineae bacterium]|nr:DUF4145 domain-containing protein [Anaerolineae bacterium]
MNWECPTCGKGKLEIKEGTLHVSETAKSVKENAFESYPINREHLYSCLFRCNNNKCREVISSSGRGYLEPVFPNDPDGGVRQDWDYKFVPIYFLPNLQFFQIPGRTPKTVLVEINESFSLFFCAPSSAANHVRRSVEELLTALKIKRYKYVGTPKKRRYVSLHDRIQLLPAKYDSQKELLLALKWLGNAGSHTHQEITKDDVLDAYEILEELLNQIYVKKKDVRKLARTINKNKGPKS